MTRITCRLTVKNRDQPRNPTLGNRVWAAFTFSISVFYESTESHAFARGVCIRRAAGPKLAEALSAGRVGVGGVGGEGGWAARRAAWARLIPDVLDRHIRVDRTSCVDDAEEALTTYDVRPIGVRYTHDISLSNTHTHTHTHTHTRLTALCP